MGKKLIFKKAGKRGKKEVDMNELLEGVLEVVIYSEQFKLYKSTGRPKTILHEWFFEDMICKNQNTDFNKIMYYTEGTRKEILGSFWGKEYIEGDSWVKLFEEIKLRDIPTPYGD